MTVVCNCGEPAVLRISGTKANPMRRFFTCSKGRGKSCGYFEFVDLPLNNMAHSLCLKWLEKVAELETQVKITKMKIMFCQGLIVGLVVVIILMYAKS